MTQTIVFLDNLDKAQREICGKCSASGQTFLLLCNPQTGLFPFPLCKPAQLEVQLKKKPTYSETQQRGIDTSFIPEGCPNGYIGWVRRFSREIG